MTLTLELPKGLDAMLSEEAEFLHMPLSDYILRALTIGRVPQPIPRTGAEVMAYWESMGILGNRPDITDPIAHARELRKRAETRQRD